MATLAGPAPTFGRDDRFFLTMAIVMALTVVAGFSFQLAMGRSRFAVPLYIHFHAFVFFGWTLLYVLQNYFVYRGVMGFHRLLGWIGAVWAVLLIVVGTYTTVAMVQRGGAPFFFQPGFFLIMNPMSLVGFAGLTAAAIAMRKQTAWHRRLMFCAMTLLLAPPVGRLLPVPFLIPYADWAVFAGILIFPLIGIAGDLLRRGSVHPAWWWGLAAVVLTQVVMHPIAESPLGVAIYHSVTAGHRGAAVPPLEFPPFPHMP